MNELLKVHDELIHYYGEWSIHASFNVMSERSTFKYKFIFRKEILN